MLQLRCFRYGGQHILSLRTYVKSDRWNAMWKQTKCRAGALPSQNYVERACTLRKSEVGKGGLFGSELTALVAYMKGSCHASFSTIRKFLRDVLNVTVSRGYLRKLITKVTDSLDHAYEEILSLLPGEDVVNVDETGHKEKGHRFWTWCFRAELYTLFRIRASLVRTNLDNVGHLRPHRSRCYGLPAPKSPCLLAR